MTQHSHLSARTVLTVFMLAGAFSLAGCERRDSTPVPTTEAPAAPMSPASPASQ